MGAKCSVFTRVSNVSDGSSALCDRELCKQEGGLLLPIDPGKYEADWICSCCQTITPHTEVQRLEDTYVAQFKNLPQGDLNAYYRFLNELGEEGIVALYTRILK